MNLYDMDLSIKSEYFFPIIAPIFLALSDLFIKLMINNEITSIPIAVVHLSVVLLFSIFTIDIWGITVIYKERKDKGELFIMWMLLMIFHLTLYCAGSFIQKYIVDISHSTEPSLILIIINPILVGSGFISLLYGRHKLWKKLGI